MGDPSERVAALPYDDSSPDAAVRTRRHARAIAGHRPEVSAALDGVRAAISTAGTLSPRLVELVRLRIAFHNQCRSCMALRYEPELVDEGLVCSLERPQEDPDLTEAERAALDFADRFACDHLSIDNAVFARLREHFDDGELVELGTRCAMFVGFGRLAATWNMVQDLPASFRGAPGEPITPWGHTEVLAVPTI